MTVYLKIIHCLVWQAGVLVSPLSSLADSVHPRSTLAPPGKELDQLSLEVKSPMAGGEVEPLVEDLVNLPLLSLPSNILQQVRSLFH